MATIKAGTYRFNDVLSAPSDAVEDFFAFESSGKEYTAMGAVFPSETAFSVVYWQDQSAGTLDLSYLTGGDEVGLTDGWQSPDFQTITIPTDTEVSAEFAEWFSANAAPVVEGVQISGKWKFKDVVDLPSDDGIEEEVRFTTMGGLTGDGSFSPDVKESWNFLWCTDGETIVYYGNFDDYDGDEMNMGFAYSVVDGWNWLYLGLLEQGLDMPDLKGIMQTIDFGTEPQTVSAEFYNWLTANATQPMASVSHNGEEIASLFPGQTATLKCAGMKMAGDVVVSVADNVGSGTTECGCKKLSGTWEFNDELNLADAPNTVIGQNISICTTYMDGSDLRTEFVDNVGIFSVALSGSVAIVITENAVSLKNGGKQVSSLADTLYAYSEGGWEYPQWKTLTFAGEQTVSAEFYKWFTANATRKDLNTVSGTWVLNDTVVAPDAPFAQFVEFGVNTTVPAYGVDLSLSANVIYFGTVDGVVTGRYYVVSSTPDLSSLGMSTPMSFKLYADAWDVASYGDGIKTITFAKEQEVSNEFYSWLTANATKQ